MSQTEFVLLLAPAANRVYAGSEAKLAAAELKICLGTDVEPITIAGVDYLIFDHGNPNFDQIARSSAALALFSREPNQLLSPVALPTATLLSDDLVTIAKYPGKTNEVFTRLMINVTMQACQTTPKKRRTILDPMCGRGTTLHVAWQLGYDTAGIEVEQKTFEALASYLKTYLRRKRLKHSATLAPVRREGKKIGTRFDASLPIPGASNDVEPLTMTVFTGDTRDCTTLFGKRQFDAIVCDAPYGIVHGSHSDMRTPKDRSPAALLRQAIPIWAQQLKPGGALGLSWNTYGLSRPDLARMLDEQGLTTCADQPWQDFAHRVDSSINRDLIVAVKQTTA